MNNWLEEETIKVEQGEIVTGEVIQVNHNEAYVYVPGLGKQEIPVPKNELAYPAPESAEDVVKVGDKIEVKVVSLGGENGGVLSKVKADKEASWKDLEGIDERKEVVDAKITQVVKGGLVAVVKGVRAFIPASQVDVRFVKDLSGFVGQTVQALPIEVDIKKQRLVLSRRILLEEERAKKQEELFATLEEGQILKGVVKRIVDYGAFIDIGGVDGLAHISDLSWDRVKHPSEVLKVGQELDVLVKSFDPETKRISLSVKDTMEDPWYERAARYEEGAQIQGKIVKLTTFGAFMEIEPKFDGLIPMSKLSDKRITRADEAVQLGQEVTVRILRIDTSKKRISLCLVNVEQPEEAAE